MGKWKEIEISKILEKTKTENPKVNPDSEFVYIDISSIDRELNKVVDPKFLTGSKAPSRARKTVENGDVIFATTRPNLQNIAIIEDNIKKQIASTGFCVLRGKKELIENRFLFNYLLTNEVQELIAPLIRGAQYPAISDKDLKSIKIPLPPLPEQQRIVAKLDGLFAKIDKAIGLLEANILHTQALMGSVLDEEFGKLEKLSTKYDKLKNLTKKIGSGSTPRGGQSSYKESGISLIRSMNVHDCYFKVKNLAFIDDIQADKLKNVEIQENDVLLNITGASVARCCIVDSNYLPARVNQHVSIIRTDERILPEFMLYFLISPKMKSKLLYDSSGNATREAITKSMIEAIDVPIISLEIQQKLINKIKESFRLNNKIIETQNQKLNHLKALKSSLLDQAFKGEL